MTRRPARIAVLGGSFDHLHVGHRALLSAGFAAADRVGIGLTTDGYLTRNPKPLGRRIEPLARRRRNLERYLLRNWSPSRWWIVPLEDSWGRSVDPGVDVLVASKETAASADAVNRERHRRGLPPLRVVLVDLVLGDDGLPVSSRRIRAGLINANGHREVPLAVSAIGFRAAEVSRLTGAIHVVLPKVRIRLVRRRLGVALSRGSDRLLRAGLLAAVDRPVEGIEYSIAVAHPRASGSTTAGVPSWVAVSSANGSKALRVRGSSPTSVARTISAAVRAVSRG
jgi:pantetheine-phosphate adenylyltransferase